MEMPQPSLSLWRQYIYPECFTAPAEPTGKWEGGVAGLSHGMLLRDRRTLRAPARRVREGGT
jgi:hypothetical protein